MLVVIKARGEKITVRKATLRDICQAIYILVQLIPQGYVASYSNIARLLNIHPRVVASCLARNKNIIVVPCHRVVHSNMRIGGYRPLGREFKRKLLQLEGVSINNDLVVKSRLINILELLEKP